MDWVYSYTVCPVACVGRCTAVIVTIQTYQMSTRVIILVSDYSSRHDFTGMISTDVT
jgi:hypothetical protein